MQRRNTNILRRGRNLKKGHPGKGPVVYWMSRDQRVTDNWALLWAQQEAMVHKKSLLVVFCLDPDARNTTPVQTDFMSGALLEIEKELQRLDIGWTLLRQHPATILPAFLHGVDAHMLVCDFNPLRHHQQAIQQLLGSTTIAISEVDSHNIIPAWTTSKKKEYAAYTIRPKIKRLLDDFLTEIPPPVTHPFSWNDTTFSKVLELMDSDSTATPLSPQTNLLPGPAASLSAASQFLKTGLQHYDADRNNPCLDGQSGLSPYLHFGHLSAQRLARMVLEQNLSQEITEPFLEELIVRRELSDNFCLYEPNYDSFSGFSNWAQKTLDEHRKDKREFTYSLETLETGNTHEVLWNCCQLDLVRSGKLHGFLRMYWAKKILEWTAEPEAALSFAITLNDRYSLDGHDPNGYAGVAWSIGGVHDRAWGERPVFGKIRYMNEKGCRRKFDVERYIRCVHRRGSAK